MKNTLILQIDSDKKPDLLIGHINNAIIDTEGKPRTVADLDLILNALIAQMHVLEKTGVRKMPELMRGVIVAIEKGAFSAEAHIQTEHNPKL